MIDMLNETIINVQKYHETGGGEAVRSNFGGLYQNFGVNETTAADPEVADLYDSSLSL